MFTGIVTDVGPRARRARHQPRPPLRDRDGLSTWPTLDIGASISHAGCCLTVVEKGEGWFAVEVSGETLAMTTLGRLAAKAAGSTWSAPRGSATSSAATSSPATSTGWARCSRWRPRAARTGCASARRGRCTASSRPKGSITVEGVSLTVNEVEDDVFGVNLIPHTWDVTTLGELEAGSRVNLEIDMLARYLARWRETA